MGFQVAYVPIGVGTYEMKSAQEQFDKSVALIKSLTDDGVFPEKILLTTEELDAYLDTLSPDLIILQNVTFANAAYATEVLRRFDCPLLLWTLREPVIDGTRLRLNSLTGAFSAANTITAFRGEGGFEYVLGGPDEEDTKKTIGAVINAARVKLDVNHLKMAAIGQTPQGFGFGRALDADLAGTFGVRLDSIEARELINRAKTYTAEDCAEERAEAEKMLTGLGKIPEQNVTDFLRLYKAYKAYVKENGIGALASRCWPDFFTEYGTPVCIVLSLLNDNGVSASCETDVYGALSMYIGSKLSGQPDFFGDPVSMDEEENTVTFWHCGMGPCCLAREDTGAEVGVHCNRKIGPTMEFGCRPCDDVTLFRIGRKKDGSFRFFIAKGSAADKPKQFFGTSVVVHTDSDARELVYKGVTDGWEPHFVVIYADVVRELEALGRMFHAEICRY